MRDGIIGIFFATFLLSCGQQGRMGRLESVTPQNQAAGKWLVTASAGVQVSSLGTLALRNEVARVFTDVKGGGYKHAVDLDDKHSSAVDATIDRFLDQLDHVKRQVAEFKRSTPGAKTMIMITLTGHGDIVSDQGVEKFLFAFSEGTLDGTETVNLIKNLGVDETILVLQSCKSGALVDLFKGGDDNELWGFAREVEWAARQQNVALSVISPVDRTLFSFERIWDLQILHDTFTDDGFDENGDGVITYEEWKNAILQRSCQSEYYVPRELHGGVARITDMGINPQFFDKTLPGGLPVFLTSKGRSDYLAGSLTLPEYHAAPAKIFEKTTAVCEAQLKLLDSLYQMREKDLLVSIKSSNGLNKVKAVFQLGVDEKIYPYSDDMLTTLQEVVTKAPEQKARYYAYMVLGDRAPKEGRDVKYDRALLGFIQNYERENAPIQAAVVYSLALAGSKRAVAIFKKALESSSDPDARDNAAIGFRNLGDTTHVPFLMEVLQKESEDFVREEIINAFADMAAKETIPLLRKIQTSDPVRHVREVAADAIKVIQGDLGKAAIPKPRTRNRVF